MKGKKVDSKKNGNPKVLFASVVADDEAILESFLISVSRFDTTTFDIHYFFLNYSCADTELIEEFKDVNLNTTIVNIDNSKENDDINYNNFDYYKRISEYALNNNFDYIFFSDFNVTYHPFTIRKLLSHKKDIVSTISWTTDKTGCEMPNVLMHLDKPFGLNDKDSEQEKLKNNLILKERGLYKISSFSGSFLLSCDLLSKGIDFSKIYILSSDNLCMHLCTKAVVNGIDVYVDTSYPVVYMDIDYNLYNKEIQLKLEEENEEEKEVINVPLRKIDKEAFRNEISKPNKVLVEEPKETTTDNVKPKRKYKKEITRNKNTIDTSNVTPKPYSIDSNDKESTEDKALTAEEIKEQILRKLYGNKR